MVNACVIFADDDDDMVGDENVIVNHDDDDDDDDDDDYSDDDAVANDNIPPFPPPHAPAAVPGLGHGAAAAPLGLGGFPGFFGGGGGGRGRGIGGFHNHHMLGTTNIVCLWHISTIVTASDTDRCFDGVGWATGRASRL